MREPEKEEGKQQRGVNQGPVGVEDRVRVFGSNDLPSPPIKGFLRLVLEASQDTMLIILMIAAVVSLAVGVSQEPSEGWIEGVAILAAVALVVLITAGNDYSKEIKFRDLQVGLYSRRTIHTCRRDC